MGAYDYLLAGKGIEAPNGIDLAKSGLSLAQLANQVEGSGLDLQQRRQMIALMQDPEFAKVMGASMGGEGGQGDQWAGLLGKYPAAGGAAMTQQMGLAKNLADIRHLNAETGKQTTDQRVAQLQVLSNAADGFANQKDPLDPAKVVTFIRQGSYIGAGPLMTDILQAAQSGDEGAVRNAFRNFSQAGSTMAQRASAGESNVKSALAPQQFDLDRYKALQAAAEKIGGEVRQDVNGQLVIVRPLAGVQMPTPPGPANVGGVQNPPASTPGGQPPQMVNGQFPAGTPAAPAASLADAVAADAAGRPTSFVEPRQAISAPPSPVAQPQTPSALPQVSQLGVQGALAPEQAAQSAIRQKTLEDSRNNANIAQRALQVIPGLRSELAQGYTGPLAGSEAGKTLLNLAVSIGALNPEQVQRVGAMRASDSLVTELLGPMAHQMASRGSNFALKIVQNAKPGSENSLPVAMQMLTALQTDARNTVNYDKALNEHVSSNPQDFGLAKWKAPTPASPPPPGKFADKLPPANLTNLGYKAYGDDGVVYVSNGREWVLQK